LQRLNPPTDAAQREEDVPGGELDLDRARFRVTVIAKGLSSSLEPTFATQIDLRQRWTVVVDVRHISQFLAAS
jgi:hypothetical protein